MILQPDGALVNPGDDSSNVVLWDMHPVKNKYEWPLSSYWQCGIVGAMVIRVRCGPS